MDGSCVNSVICVALTIIMRLRQWSELLEETQPGEPGMLLVSGETQSNESRINQVNNPHCRKPV